MTKAQIAGYVTENGYAMTAEDMLCAQDYFKSEKRDPTVTELKVLDTYWSDHCRHTTFLTKLDEVEFGSGPLSKAAQRVYEDYLDTRRKLGSKKRRVPDGPRDYLCKGSKARGQTSHMDESKRSTLAPSATKYRHTTGSAITSSCLKMKRITIPRRSNRSAARQRALAGRSAIRFRDGRTFTRRCA